MIYNSNSKARLSFSRLHRPCQTGFGRFAFTKKMHQNQGATVNLPETMGDIAIVFMTTNITTPHLGL